MSQVITNAFEQYWQSCLAAEKPVVLDEFILADIPNLDITSPIDPETGLPPESQIVHRQNVDQRGRINNNAVAYTIVMDTTVGDFSFNAMYLRNKQNGVIGMIVYKGRETKLKTDQTTGQTGNSLVKSMLMGYDQAAEATLTHVDAGTWQIDYAARLRGMDEDLRQLASQLYGHHTFIGDGFKVVEKDGAYQVTQGVAIIGGLRVELKAPEVIHPGTKPIGVWVDVHRSGSLLSEHQNHFTIITSVAELADHVDESGYPHYVAKLATVQANSTVIDGRGQGSSGGAGAIQNTYPLWKQVMAEAGYDLIGQFGVSTKLTNAKQALLSSSGEAAYRWNGAFPKEVDESESPSASEPRWIVINGSTRNLAINDILPGKFAGNPLSANVGDVLPPGSNLVRVNGAVYQCTPPAGGTITMVAPRFIVAGGVKSYLSHISRHVSGTRKPMNWKLEISINDADVTNDLKAIHGYTVMGFQGLYIDKADSLVYVGWQTLNPGSVWVTVHDWITGELVTRLHFPNNVGAPEGIHVARVSGQRYIMLPYSPKRSIRTYAIGNPRTIADKTQFTSYVESDDLGVRYQFSGWANTLLYENADQGWPKIFDKETGVSNIFNQLAITNLISGSYSPRGSITIDSNVVGRGAGKPKRQGIALGSHRIYAGIGASTEASAGWTFAGLQGYVEYSLDGKVVGQYLITPADFKAYWDSYVGLNTQSTENEGIQSSDVAGIEEQYLLQSVRYLSAQGVNYRTLNIIRVNCPSNEPGVLDLGARTSSAAYDYNPRGRTVNAGRYAINPMDGMSLFTSVQAITEYMRGSDIGTYVVYSESNMFMFEGDANAPGQVVIPAFNHIRIDYVNADTWNVTVTGTNRANNYTGRISKNGGFNAFTKIPARSISVDGAAGLRDVSIQSLKSKTLPTFAGDWSTGVSHGTTGGITDWQPPETGNGALWEAGYATNRVLQQFMSTSSRFYFRYVDDVARNANAGWAEAWSTLNTTVDASGFIKKASPIIKIFSDGSFEHNRESEGVMVNRVGIGQYLITGCLGPNADTAWGGFDGGFEIPVDRNKQPLIWLDYEVNQDGSILVKTYHRSHPASPDFAKNIVNGVFDGDPFDIPKDQFVSVRVQMPNDSIWNRKMNELLIADQEIIFDDESNEAYSDVSVLP